MNANLSRGFSVRMLVCMLGVCTPLLVLAAGCGSRHSTPSSSSESATPTESSAANSSTPSSSDAAAQKTDAAAQQPAAQQSEPAPKQEPEQKQPEQKQPAQKQPEVIGQKADVGVGAKGRGYGEGFIATPAASLFAAQEKVVFQIQIPQAMNLFKASEGRPPKSHDEFMQRIIKENQIKLPQLPEGKRYQYDPKTAELMVVDA